MYHFLEMLLLTFSPRNVQYAGECCKAQRVCVDQRIARYESYLLFDMIIPEWRRGASTAVCTEG